MLQELQCGMCTYRLKEFGRSEGKILNATKSYIHFYLHIIHAYLLQDGPYLEIL